MHKTYSLPINLAKDINTNKTKYIYFIERKNLVSDNRMVLYDTLRLFS